MQTRWPEWTSAIDHLGPELWSLFGARLNALLKQRGLKPGARLVWLPSGWLGTLPLGLAQDPASHRRLIDDYEIVYAPSLEALAAAQELAEQTRAAHARSYHQPHWRPSGDRERRRYRRLALLTRGAHVAGARRRHAAGRPLGSQRQDLLALRDTRRLFVAGRAPIGIARARSGSTHSWSAARDRRARHPRLVVLSACETGLYDIASSPDEFIGLPGTFTALGAAGVLGTLWPVSDDATALLMAKFYELHMDLQLSPPVLARGANLAAFGNER